MEYRILKVGERLIDGDEVLDTFNDGGGWTKTTVPGCKVIDELVGSYRRPLKAVEARKPVSNKQMATCPHCGKRFYLKVKRARQPVC